VVRRWGRLFPPRGKDRQPLEVSEDWVAAQLKDAKWVGETRKRLNSLGWLMKCLVVPCCSDTCDKSRRHIPCAVACLENTAISGHGTRRVPATLTSVTRVCLHWHLQVWVLPLGSGGFADSKEQSVGGPFLEPLLNSTSPVLFISQRMGGQRHVSDESDCFAKANICH